MHKQILKKVLVPTLCSKPVSYVVSKLFEKGIPIFMLHRVYPDNTPRERHTPSYLRKCLTYLKKNNYHFASVSDILESIHHGTTLPRNTVAFTIDDGFYDQASLAAPVFVEFNCPVTIFLITDFIDGKMWPWFSKVDYLLENSYANSIFFNFGTETVQFPLNTPKEKSLARAKILKYIKTLSWDLVDKKLLELSKATQLDIPAVAPNESKPMTWSMARELENTCVSFGPHTLTHPILSKVNDLQANREIFESWKRMKEELKNPAPVFCYPNGNISDYGHREIDIVRNAELLGAVSTIPKQLRPDSMEPDEQYYLPRYGLPDNFLDFQMYSGWIEGAKEKFRGSSDKTETLY